MQASAKLCAARWEVLVEFEKHSEIRPTSIRPRETVTGEYINILTTSTRIFQLAQQAISKAEEQYDHDIEMRIKTDGRIIDPSMPVRYSGAITDIAAVINNTEQQMSELHHRIKDLADAAQFNGTSDYEEIALAALRKAKKIVDLAELHPRTHLWLVWINESLSQASQIHYQIVEGNRFEGHGTQAFTYVAHPPLIVATVGCTATVEEVGAFYLNRFTERSHNPDNTSSKEILRDLKETYPHVDPETIDEIIDTIVKARNELSHYISKRERAIPIDDVGRFIEVCQRCVRMIGGLVREMAEVRLSQFNQEVFY